jgi:E3 ubiquitin-protein ligase RAD18
MLTRNTQNPPPNSKVMTRIPKVNYAMYNDSKLRGLLAELGLPTYGNRSLLSTRHKEYVNLHNANIDRPHPQSRTDLIRQLERWDATQQTLSRGEKRKELDGKEWGVKCKDDFADLARQARASAKRRKVEHNVSDDAQQQNVEASNGDTANNMGSSIVMSSQEETVAL